MAISEDVAYIKGMLDAYAFEDNSREGKLFSAIVDALDNIAYEVASLSDDTNELSEYIEEIDEDLGELEEYVYEMDDDCCCDDCCDDDDDDDDDDDYCGCDECDSIEFKCPGCGENVIVDIDALEENDDGDVETVCPSCGETITLDIVDE